MKNRNLMTIAAALTIAGSVSLSTGASAQGAMLHGRFTGEQIKVSLAGQTKARVLAMLGVPESIMESVGGQTYDYYRDLPERGITIVDTKTGITFDTVLVDFENGTVESVSINN
jgi:hypothetical protein